MTWLCHVFTASFCSVVITIMTSSAYAIRMSSAGQFSLSHLTELKWSKTTRVERNSYTADMADSTTFYSTLTLELPGLKLLFHARLHTGVVPTVSTRVCRMLLRLLDHFSS